MRDVSIIFLYYNFPEVLDFHIKNWSSFDSETRKRLHFIIVDDGSPIPIKLDFNSLNINLSAFRIYEDIFFNTAGAKNLGAAMANTEWLYFTLAEYIIDNDNITRLINSDFDDNTAYCPLRKRWDGTEKTIRIPKYERKLFHWCNVVIKKDKFWDVGGMDEDFSGHWGSDDSHFARRVRDKMNYVTPWRDVFVRDVDPIVIKGSQIDETFKWPKGKTEAGGHNSVISKNKGITHSTSYFRFNWSVVGRSKMR